MVLQSRDCVFKMSIFKQLSIVLYRVNWYMYIFILKSEVQTSSSRVSTSRRVSNRFSTRLNLYCIQSSTDARLCVSSSSTVLALDVVGTRSTNIMDSMTWSTGCRCLDDMKLISSSTTHYRVPVLD